MGHLTVTVLTSVAIFLTYYLLLVTVSAKSLSANENQKPQSPALGNNKQEHNYRRFLRSSIDAMGNMPGSQRVLQISRSKIPIELDLLLDEDEGYDKSKRYDDYGHMRFGKRGEDPFDDYGHMRFGKRGDFLN